MLSKKNLTNKENKLAIRQKRQPGKEYKMVPRPQFRNREYIPLTPEDANF